MNLQKIKSQYKAIQIVNKELIFMYWHIGKIIVDNSKWGNKFIDNLSMDLKLEFPNITGFSIRNLKYMKKLQRSIQTLNLCNRLLHKFHGDII